LLFSTKLPTNAIYTRLGLLTCRGWCLLLLTRHTPHLLLSGLKC
jgi:hypothetical protein